jgi:hypothetical protein
MGVGGVKTIRRTAICETAYREFGKYKETKGGLIGQKKPLQSILL